LDKVLESKNLKEMIEISKVLREIMLLSQEEE
jgi:hypothetical protein